MEHIATPAEPAYLPPKVPCLSDLAYDSGDFLSYPARRGWDGNRLATGDFTEHGDKKAAAFLQDWLYFGTLVATLGEKATKSAFTNSGYVTTTHLEELIQLRILSIHELINDSDKHAEELIQQTEACLSQVSYYCCLTGADHDGAIDWPLTPEIDLSIRLLGQRLSGAYEAGLGNIAGQGVFLMAESILWQLKWPPPILVTQRLVEQGWCPSNIERAVEQFSPSSMYYISQLKHPALSKDHSRCSTRKCVAFQVNEDTYQTKHTTAGCDCAFLGPDVDTVVNIIEAGKIPLLTIDIDSSTVRILVEPHLPENTRRPEQDYDFGPVRILKAARDYVAISHVWADGLGNAKYNALPYCQLHRLKAILDELRDQKSSLSLLNVGKVNAIVRKKRNLSLRFWMDTLCIPVDPRLKHIRIKAIKNMKDVYDRSNQVLVLDADLQNVPSSMTDLTEKFMRISLSGWMQRLWTLQEGVLGGRLHFKFKDKILDIQKMYDDIREGEHRRRGDIVQGIARRVANVKGTPRSDSVQFFWRMRTMRAAMFPDDEVKSFGHQSQGLDAETQQRVLETRRLAGIMTAFEAARFRTTSRSEDVYLCLGSLLGWAGTDLSSVPPERRLRSMLEQQNTLPKGIIFVPGPRNVDLGWRWAVTDFDNAEQTMMKARIEDYDAAVRDHEGLTLTYPGLVLPKEASQALVKGEILVANMNYGHRKWWHVRSLEKLSSAQETLCLLYFAHSPKQIPQRLIPMAAAAITVEKPTDEAIFDSKKRVYGRFEFLANVQMIGSTEEMELYARRLDCKAQRIEQMAGVIIRAWTIQ